MWLVVLGFLAGTNAALAAELAKTATPVGTAIYPTDFVPAPDHSHFSVEM